jgi:hypothetical protein
VCVSVAGRCHYFETTVMIQRLSAPDVSSFTEQTISVTVDAMSVNVAFWPPVSGIAGAVLPRLDWSFPLSACCYRGRGTRNNSATNPRYQRNINQRFPLIANRAPQTPGGPGLYRGSKLLFPRDVSFCQFLANHLRLVFSQPCNEPPLKHCRAFGVSVPHHPIEPGIASHNKTR